MTAPPKIEYITPEKVETRYQETDGERTHDLRYRHHVDEAGKQDDFIKGTSLYVETQKEKGCFSYDGHVSVNNPNLYVVVERWETRDDSIAAWPCAPHEGVAGVFLRR